jgi:hypothetical protein
VHEDGPDGARRERRRQPLHRLEGIAGVEVFERQHSDGLRSIVQSSLDAGRARHREDHV